MSNSTTATIETEEIVQSYSLLNTFGKVINKEAWISFITTKHLTDWTHVYQTKEMEDADFKIQKPGFRQLYDVTLTPTLYLLDKEKRIIGKKLSLLQLNDQLEVKWKNKVAN